MYYIIYFIGIYTTWSIVFMEGKINCKAEYPQVRLIHNC